MSRENPKFIDYLPSIYQENEFLEKFLIGFEKLLLGDASDTALPAEGLERSIEQIPKLFSPQETPVEFLDWLAGWTALSIKADLTVEQQRNLIANIIPLYRRRGTKENLADLFAIFGLPRPDPERDIIETGVAELQIAVNSTVGVDTYIAGGAPHIFEITIRLPAVVSQSARERQQETALAIVELAKPAHTQYRHTFSFPTMQIGVTSTVGVDTVIGTESA